MKIKITVTKDVLRRSMWCGTIRAIGATGENCAIALAIRDIFPDAHVGYHAIRPNGLSDNFGIMHISDDTTFFIQTFDSLLSKPEKRILLPEYSFEIDLPDELVAFINIDDIHKSKTLEVVS